MSDVIATPYTCQRCGRQFGSQVSKTLCWDCRDPKLPPIDWQSRALAAEQERDQFKAELQQVREVAGLKNSSVSLVNEIRHLMEQADILERIEKEKK